MIQSLLSHSVLDQGYWSKGDGSCCISPVDKCMCTGLTKMRGGNYDSVQNYLHVFGHVSCSIATPKFPMHKGHFVADCHII